MRKALSSRLRTSQMAFYSPAVAASNPTFMRAVALKVTTMLSVLNLLDRYLPLILRDRLRIGEMLYDRGPLFYRNTWVSAVQRLPVMTPNIHDFFLRHMTVEEAPLTAAGGLYRGPRILSIIYSLEMRRQ